MPFAGEIMEVKPEEQKWEGALERLLGEFGVSLLVPESLYGKVIDWMENIFSAAAWCTTVSTNTRRPSR